MDPTPILCILLYLYLALVIAKTILCYANIPAVVAALNRWYGPHTAVYTLTCLVSVPVLLAVRLPIVIWEERLGFFVLYSNFRAMRDARQGVPK